MEKGIDIYNYDLKLKRALEAVKGSGLTEQNKKLILSFKEQCVVEGLSKPRIIKYLGVLKGLAAQIGKDFDKATIEDIRRIVAAIQENSYSVWTKHSYKVIIKRFYKWLKGGNEDYPPEVKWIKCSVKRSEMRLPAEGELLTEEEIKKLIETADNSRNKALVAVLSESGCRIGEVSTLRIRNVQFDKYGIVLVVNGKTGSRKIRILSATPYLSVWMQNHPLKNDKNAPLWISIGTRNHHRVIVYGAIRQMLKKLFSKAGIKKRFNPHMFRHSRATFLANHLTEFQMNQYFGWIQGSDMPSTYVHMSGREIDQSILELNGIEVPKQRHESSLKPIICPKCSCINAHDSRFCSRCASILDIKTAVEIEQKTKQERQARSLTDEIMNKLMGDPEVQQLLLEKIAKMGVKDKLTGEMQTG